MPTEATIAACLAQGELDRAAEAAIRGFGPKILGLLRTVLRDETAAADAFSLFAENLWRGLPSFRGESSVRTWSYRLAWNAALTVRDEGWRRLGRRLETTQAARLAEDVRTRSAARVERQLQAVAKLREALEPEEQALLTLRIDQQLSWEEIASVLSGDGAPVQPATLRKRFERLKEKLAARAREQGLVE
ncbi:RNA polymerase sigma factor [Anaeromyxobacter paludicola]|uniref:RNA polymerase sigma factor YlaC n=1 Tax=Anaeromyxobacter paludicola TaxID=2918171 RepID=A0ABM7XC12_9BACT|nr:sigma-70 family RNA polymerase sigma factor [Anaeromyxobacter paludicola]BDG09395.1 RNA polymerase sigma factor YlaC [Anaeromyxobacter paludicola]